MVERATEILQDSIWEQERGGFSCALGWAGGLMSFGSFLATAEDSTRIFNITLLAQGSLKLPMVRTTGHHQSSCDNALEHFQITSWFTTPPGELCTHCVQNHIDKPHFWEVLCKIKGQCLPFLPTVISCGRGSMVMDTHNERQVKCNVANYHPKHT